MSVLYLANIGINKEELISIELVDSAGGHAHIVKINKKSLFLERNVSNTKDPFASGAKLYEDRIPLGKNNSSHDYIRSEGLGSFSDWDGYLYFSSSDNSDPKKNKRVYTLSSTWKLNSSLAGTLIGLLILFTVFPIIIILDSKLKLAFGISLRTATSQIFMPINLAYFARIVVGIILVFSLTQYLDRFDGVLFWLIFYTIIILSLIVLHWLYLLVLSIWGFQAKVKSIQNLVLSLVSMGLMTMILEGYLVLSEAYIPKKMGFISNISNSIFSIKNVNAAEAPPYSLTTQFTLPAQLKSQMYDRENMLSLPESWERKEIIIPGAKWAYSWHGVNHIFDENNFRRLNGPFLKKKDDIFRVMVVGDSMTYGAGINERWTYSAQLERELKKHYRIEVINLGVNGHQSEDIVKVIEEMLPIIQPNLVVYGFCYNDFLPSGVGQYINNNEFPLPAQFKRFMKEHTRLSRLIYDGYESLLLKLNLSPDFYQDILRGLKGYQDRFSVDVARMNQVVKGAGLPPIIAIPLTQSALKNSDDGKISALGSKLMRDQGLEVLPLDDFYKKYDGKVLRVSRWEGHPNEEANAFFASSLYDNLIKRNDLKAYLLNAYK